jgi:hypothetical protein
MGFAVSGLLRSSATRRVRSELLPASDDVSDLVASVRRYLCLGPEGDADIAQALEPRLVRRDGLVALPLLAVVAISWNAPGAAT